MHTMTGFAGMPDVVETTRKGAFGLKAYLVGGAVRDSLLGQAISEKDWVVIGATPEEMLNAGFRPVGKDFPVFLHPETREEYALARTERKTAPGYHGFSFHATPNVTLEEDLGRRDLTINAIAQDGDNRLIDPYGGVNDIEQRVLKHVSEAFAEDPVRVLRVARFAARFHKHGFTIADRTQHLMRQMTAQGEIDVLVPERVWAETCKALCEEKPSVYFEVLRACGALQKLFPELDHLWDTPQPEYWQPEIDTGVHTMMALDMAAHLTKDVQVRFATLTHDLGKGATSSDTPLSQHNHEQCDIDLIRKLCRRYRVPRQYRDLATVVAKYHGHFHRITEMRPATILRTLYGIDALRRPARFRQYVLACEADLRVRTGLAEIIPQQTRRIEACYEAATSVDIPAVVRKLKGEQARAAIDNARITAIDKLGLRQN